MKINTTALVRGTVGVIWLIVAMTIGAEISVGFKNLMVQVGGHHWVGKGIVAVIAFFLIYLVSRKSVEPKNILFSSLFVVGSVVTGGLIIFLFYLGHFLNS